MGKSGLDDKEFDLRIKEILDGAQEEVPAHVWDSLSSRLDSLQAARPGRALWWRYAWAVAAAAALVFGVFFAVRSGGDGVEVEGIAVVEPDNVGVEAVDPDGQDGVSGTGIAAEDEGERQEEGGAVGREGQKSLADQIRDSRSLAMAEGGTQTDSPERQPVVGKVSEAGVQVVPDNSEIMEGGSGEGESGVSKVSSGQGERVKPDKGSEDREQDGGAADGFDDWAFFEDEEQPVRRGPQVAVTLSGNALSNGSTSSRSGGRRAPMFGAMMEAANADRNDDFVSETGGTNTFGIPVSFGFGAKIIFTPRWSLGVGINYSLLSRTFAGSFVHYGEEAMAPQITPYSKIRNSQSYVGVPVNVFFSVVKSRAVDFYVYAGGSAEKCISNVYKMAEPENTFREGVRGLQYSANAGIGVEFIVADVLGFYVDPSLRYYIPDNSQPKSIRTEHPLTFGFEIGMRVRL